MADYIIKDIPEDVMRNFKTACAWFKRSMREELLTSMGETFDRYQADVSMLVPEEETIKHKE